MFVFLKRNWFWSDKFTMWDWEGCFNPWSFIQLFFLIRKKKKKKKHKEKERRLNLQSINFLPFVKLLIKNAKVPVKTQSSPSWQELSAVSYLCTWDYCRIGTKCSGQAKCFILLALVSSTYTLSSGRTAGYFSPILPETISIPSCLQSVFQGWGSKGGTSE